VLAGLPLAIAEELDAGAVYQQVLFCVLRLPVWRNAAAFQSATEKPGCWQTCISIALGLAGDGQTRFANDRKSGLYRTVSFNQLRSTCHQAKVVSTLGDAGKFDATERLYTMKMDNFVSTNEKMKSVKAAWDKAPAGPKKDAALTHYKAAEKSHSAQKETECLKSLDAATAALA